MKKILHYFLAAFIITAVSFEISLADPVIKNTATATKKSTVKKKKLLLRNGSIYVLSTQKRGTVSYSRNYSKSGKNLFVTTYNVYNNKKESIANIKAVHDKKMHTVLVEVRDFQVQGNPLVNSEKTIYGAPFMGRFGSIGKVGTGGDKAKASNPGQIMVKFLSKRFDYVNVVSIADAHEDSGKELQVYILDEKSAL